MGPDPSLTPELIQSQSFTSAFRGLDPGEVRAFLARVAADVRAWRERAEPLESVWRSAEERAARPPVLDEEALIDAVGDETASVLRTARAAAAELRAKAAAEAEQRMSDSQAAAETLLADAKAQAESLIDKAEQDVEAMKSECAASVDLELRESAESAANLVAKAQSDAAELLERSRNEAAAIASKAEQERLVLIEGANANRERILEDLARRRRVATVQIEQLRAGRERLIDSYALVRRTLDDVQSELARADAEARAAADAVGRRLRSETGEQASVEPASVEPVSIEPVSIEPVSIEPVSIEPVSIEPGVGEPTGSVETTDVSPTGSAVDELFARIRANRGEAPPEQEMKTRQGGASDEAVVGNDTSLVVADEPGDVVPDEEESLLQRRESAIGELEVLLTRSLKRALQDEQNDLLDKLRLLSGDLNAELLLGEEEAQVATYVGIVSPLLAQAAAKGSAFAVQCLESPGSDGLDRDGSTPVDDLADNCARGLATALRRRLEQAIESVSADGPAGHVEDRENLVEAIGSAYREWKSQRIERLGGDALCAAFSRGTWSTVPGGAALRWIVDDPDGPCPDCDDDALAGELPKPEEFPTGQLHPPAHGGCRCLLVPVAVAASQP